MTLTPERIKAAAQVLVEVSRIYDFADPELGEDTEEESSDEEENDALLDDGFDKTKETVWDRLYALQVFS